MEKKNQDQKLSSACNQQSQTNEPQNRQEEAAQPNVTLGPSHDNVPNSNQQQQPSIFQWPYTPPNAKEQFYVISIPTQAPPRPGTLSQWQQQLPHPQQGQVFANPTLPFWQPQLPTAGGGPVYPFVQGGTSSTTQPLVPNMCYPVGYTFPGFPGPWDPSSCLAQMHQLQHPYVYNFSGASTWMPGCLVSGEHSLQRGIIKPPAKLSQKHQQLWEAQSMENAQLRSLIDKLQAEVSDYKDRLSKLEEEVSSLKHKVEEPTNEVVETIPVGTVQPSKRGRPPKRSLASVDALHESQPRARGRKPALSKPQFENRSPFFEKVILKKVENKEIANHSTATRAPQREINEKTLNGVTNVSGNIHVNQSNSMVSALQGQIHQEYQGVTHFEKDKDKDLKFSYCKQSQPDKVLESNMGVSAKYIGNNGNGNLGWTSGIGIPSQDSAKDMLDVAKQGFFHNGSFIQQGGNTTPGWNFANEEDASEELEEANVGSTKDENEEEMGDDTSSAAKEIGVSNYSKRSVSP